MKRLGSLSFAILAVVCLLLATERRAFGFSGYVDPGFGLMALQCGMSALAATAYYLRRRIKGLFTKKDKAPLSPEVADTTKDPHQAA
jgi:hypothetical protein